ncbi:MAG: transferase [Leptospira sp.]|nr:MAG: transferase [Leptospira sp.]
MQIFKIIKKEILLNLEFFISLAPGSIGNFLRRLYYKIRLKSLGEKTTFSQFIVIESPENITINNNSSIGSYNFFTANGGEIEIGKQVSFNRNVHLNASVGGKISLGDYCLIAPNVVMRTANHNYDEIQKPIRFQGHTIGNIILENNVWIGSNVVILKDVRIGEGSIIASGSVVTKSIPPNVIAGGIPAKIIKKRI